MSDKKKTPTPSSYDWFDNKAGLVEEILTLDTYGRTTIAHCKYTVKPNKDIFLSDTFDSFSCLVKASTTCSVEDASSGKFDVDLGYHIALNKARAKALTKYGKYLVAQTKEADRAVTIFTNIAKHILHKTASTNDTLIGINDYLSKTREN